MKIFTKKAEYTMERSDAGFAFAVKEREDYCKVRIDYISEIGAELFFATIRKYGVKACQLTAVAEDSALDAVTEIFRGLL